MSAEDVKSQVIEPMMRQFYPPKQNMPANDQQEALRDYIGALQGFDAEDLKAAWTEVCATHTKPAWPLPAVFVAAARAARKARLPADVISEREQAKASGAAKWETWKRVCRSPLAQEACRLNVAWALKCAVLTDGKAQESINLRELASSKRAAQQTALRISAGEQVQWRGRSFHMSDANAALAMRLWDSILQAEARTQAEINYGREAA